MRPEESDIQNPQEPADVAEAMVRERVAAVLVDDAVDNGSLSRRSGRYSPPINEGCRRPRAGVRVGRGGVGWGGRWAENPFSHHPQSNRPCNKNFGSVRSAYQGVESFMINGINDRADCADKNPSPVVAVLIPSGLRRFTNQVDSIEVEASNVGQALRLTADKYPLLRTQIFADEQQLRRFVNVFLNSQDIRFLQQQQTQLKSRDVITILPAIAGG
jgi:molybdopterin synthase sulfur carrier subunit